MTVVRYEPWSLINRWQREFAAPTNDSGTIALTPEVDVQEDADKYLVRADLPGVAPADIQVTTDQGVLTIRGERKSEKRETTKRYERFERLEGTFVSRFTLPEDADAESIKAQSHHGVLTLTIAKHARLAPRRVTVEAA